MTHDNLIAPMDRYWESDKLKKKKEKKKKDG